MWEDVKFTQQMHFLLSWPRRGGEGVPGPLEVGGGELRATPSPHRSCPGHMDFFFFFGFCQSSVSAWEVLAGDAENKTACLQGALRQVLRWCSVFPAPGSALILSRHGLNVLQMGFGSSTIHGEQPQVRRVRGSGPRDCPPFRCHSQVQAVTCASDPLGTNWRFPRPLPGVWLIWSILTAEKHLLTLFFFILLNFILTLLKYSWFTIFYILSISVHEILSTSRSGHLPLEKAIQRSLFLMSLWLVQEQISGPWDLCWRPSYYPAGQDKWSQCGVEKQRDAKS